MQTSLSEVRIARTPLLAGRVHGWLASKAAIACADCLAAYACGAACEHSCKLCRVLLQWPQKAHIYALKEVFQVVTQLLAHLLQLRILSQLELMPQSALSVEIYPVVHPAIGL